MMKISISVGVVLVGILAIPASLARAADDDKERLGKLNLLPTMTKPLWCQ